MTFTTLIETDTLAAHLADPAWALVDCRFQLHDPAWGEPTYLEGHISGAVYAHLDRDLSGPLTGSNGRHPLPDPTVLAGTLGRFGIDADTQVVVYDQDTNMFASRLWWLLRWLGHQRVAVLDGGFARWVAEGRPTTTGRETRTAVVFTGRPRPRRGMVVDAATVQGMMNDTASRLVDGRAPERYRGDVEPIDRAAGHIPGAVNHYFEWNLTEEGRFRSPDELRLRLGSLLTDDLGEPISNVVCYCGSGVTACHNLLALEHAGFLGAKLYPGSWSEWSSDPTRPVEKS